MGFYGLNLSLLQTCQITARVDFVNKSNKITVVSNLHFHRSFTYCRKFGLNSVEKTRMDIKE